MAIRYDKDLNAEIRRTVSNFNKKIRRLEATEQEIIPESITIKELKTTYKDRKQLKRRLRQLRDFSKRGAERVLITPGGAEMTVWEYETGKADYTMVKRRYLKQIKLGQFKAPSPYLKKDSEQNVMDKLEEMGRSFKELSQNQLEFVQKMVNREIKNRYYSDVFKTNVLNKLKTVLSDKGYNASILERLSNFTGDELLMMYKNEQALQDIMEYGDTLGMTNQSTVTSKMHPEATISRGQFDDIVEKMVNNLPRYEKQYKK